MKNLIFLLRNSLSDFFINISNIFELITFKTSFFSTKLLISKKINFAIRIYISTQIRITLKITLKTRLKKNEKTITSILIQK